MEIKTALCGDADSVGVRGLLDGALPWHFVYSIRICDFVVRVCFCPDERGTKPASCRIVHRPFGGDTRGTDRPLVAALPDPENIAGRSYRQLTVR